MTTNTDGTRDGVMRTIALSKINVEEGFNPREHFDRRELVRLADSIRLHGVLVPLLVTPDGDGEYRLIAGNRRYLAAAEAGMTEVPAIVRCPTGDEDGLDWAVLENAARVELNPVEEARAYRRLLDAGLTKRGVAERLSVSQKRVTERLRVLDVPETLHAQIAEGSIPPAAVRALAELAQVHPALPQLAAACVAAEPEHPWQEQVGWGDIAEDPAAVIANRPGDLELPPGVYELGGTYRATDFGLDEKTERKLAALATLIQADREAITVRFGRAEADYAQKLGAAYPADGMHHVLIVGQEVADTLAADAIARELKARRAQAREARESDQSRNGSTSTAVAPMSEEERKEQARAAREIELETRRAAFAYNDELGAAVFSQLSRVKIDERVVKILTAVDLEGDLARIAMRGARYGFPGWVTQTETSSGKQKHDYLGSREAAERARAFLAGARSTGDYAGRCLALVVMARLADEHAVPASARSFFELGFGGYYDQNGLPWSDEVLGLIEEIACERLPSHLTEWVIRERADREREDAERRVADAKRARAVAELREGLADMGPEERREAIEALRAQHGWHVSLTELTAEARRLDGAVAAAQDTGCDPETKAQPDA